jgi:predicted transcriptional regulator
MSRGQTSLYIAGEDIEVGDACVLSMIDGKVYRAGPVAGELLGNAVENVREGFRIAESGGQIREDDA